MSLATAPRFRPLGGVLGGDAQLVPSFLTVLGDTVTSFLRPCVSGGAGTSGPLDIGPLARSRGACAAIYPRAVARGVSVCVVLAAREGRWARFFA